MALACLRHPGDFCLTSDVLLSPDHRNQSATITSVIKPAMNHREAQQPPSLPQLQGSGAHGTKHDPPSPPHSLSYASRHCMKTMRN
ncbi:unnamed protein product [Arctogadus glacialis]